MVALPITGVGVKNRCALGGSSPQMKPGGSEEQIIVEFDSQPTSNKRRKNTMASRKRKPGESFKRYRENLKIEEKMYKARLRGMYAANDEMVTPVQSSPVLNLKALMAEINRVVNPVRRYSRHK